VSSKYPKLEAVLFLDENFDLEFFEGDLFLVIALTFIDVLDAGSVLLITVSSYTLL
jgi:hypothetical protein